MQAALRTVFVKCLPWITVESGEDDELDVKSVVWSIRKKQTPSQRSGDKGFSGGISRCRESVQHFQTGGGMRAEPTCKIRSKGVEASGRVRTLSFRDGKGGSRPFCSSEMGS